MKRIRPVQSLTVKQFQRLLGLMAAASNVIPFGLLHMRPLQWWLRTKGFSLEGQPLSYDQGHAAMLSCLGNVEETLVPVPGSSAGSFMSSQDANDRCLSHGLGSDSRGTLESRSVEGPASLMAHQPSGDVGCISCSQECPSRSQGPPCACPLRQHVGGLLLKSPGGFAVTSTLQTGEPNPPVVPKEVVSLSSLHPRGPQYRSRHPPIFLRAEARGMEAPPRGGGADMEARVDLFISRETSHCPLWFSLTHPAPPRPDAMMQTWPRLCLYTFPPIALLPRVLERVCQDRVLLLLIALRWPGRVWLPDLISILDGPPLELPIRRDLLSHAGVSIFHPNQNCGNCGLGLWGGPAHRLRSLNRDCWDYSPLQSSLHEETLCLEVESFTSWCSDHQLDTVNCPVGTVLEFLQDRLTAGLPPSTLKVYVAAISAYHITLGGMSSGKTPWYLVLLRGALRLRFCKPSVLLLSECGPEKAQFALPSAGIKCLRPQSCPVA